MPLWSLRRMLFLIRDYYETERHFIYLKRVACIYIAPRDYRC